MSLRTLVLFFTSFALLACAHSALAQNVFEPWAKKQQREERIGSPSGKTTTGDTNSYNHDFESRTQKRALTSPLSKAQKFPSAKTNAEAKPSALENMYSGRIINELEQFGYDLFGVPSEQTQQQLNQLSENTKPMGAVQDEFVLSGGDELEIMFTGQRNDRDIYTVNDQGLLLIQDFPPIPAAGRSIGSVRLSVQAAADNLHNTDAHVSLASVRQINVLVVGHVKRPGKQTLTVFNTVLDALMQAGGVEKTGSLRQIKLVRDGRSNIVDIYGLLMHGSTAMDLNLRDGDRLIIPAIGPTVAVAGEAKRPGIYEILPAMRGMRHQPEGRSEKLTLNEMLELGGGVLAPGKNRHLKLEVTPSGEETVNEIHDGFKPVFGDGSILMIAKGSEKRAGMVELLGHTRRPGLHALTQNTTLAELLSSTDILGENIYPLIGTIQRWDEDQLTHKIISYPLRLVLKGEYDQRLHDGDVVQLYSTDQIANLQNHNAETEIAEGSYNETDIEDDTTIADEIIRAFLIERGVYVRGAVRKPGLYPVGEGITLDSLLAAAGGLSLEANSANIEITSDYGGTGTRRTSVNLNETNPADILINPGDAVRINQKFKKLESKSVLIIGEVRTPGRYDLMPGDKISDLLERAGGFTQQAYPEGAILSRENERRAEEARFQAQARDIKRSIATALEIDDDKVNAGKIAEARALAEELENAQGIGRITVEADLAKLTAQPELDALLEPGDRIYIPKRSLNVRVSGEVLSPAALQFRQKKDPLDYIHEAGGFTFHADKERTFVLYPDGSAQPLQVSAWNHKASFIPPGSTIVVPRDPEPFDFIESAKDISQILSNLAITTIFIDDVVSDD